MRLLDYETTEDPGATCQGKGLIVEAEFVPYSKHPRSVPNPKKVSDLFLAFNVVVKNELGEIATPYSMGVGHCQYYKRELKHIGHQVSVYDYEKLLQECESHQASSLYPRVWPDPLDIIYCLLADSEAIDYTSFEDWAESCGYDTDSRKAEKTYQDCLRIGLSFRRMVSDTGLEDLREAFRDY